MLVCGFCERNFFALLLKVATYVNVGSSLLIYFKLMCGFVKVVSFFFYCWDYLELWVMIRGGFHTFFLFFGVLCKSIFIIVPYQGIQCKLDEENVNEIPHSNLIITKYWLASPFKAPCSRNKSCFVVFRARSHVGLLQKSYCKRCYEKTIIVVHDCSFLTWVQLQNSYVYITLLLLGENSLICH